MIEFFSNMFTREFMPHGHCYYWQPTVLWLHVGSDIAIGLAYFSIPVALIYLVRRRSDLEFNWILLLFAAFIFACGATHFAGVLTTWHPMYRFEGVVKLVTAVLSLITAALLWPLIPRALRLPSAQLLQDEIFERKKAEEELRETKRGLEVEVEKRTEELSQTVEELEGFNRMAVGREERMIELKREINALCRELSRPPRYDLDFLENIALDEVNDARS